MKRLIPRLFTPMAGILGWTAAVLMAVLSTSSASAQSLPPAQVLPGAGGMWSTATPLESHGWMVAPWSEQWALVHVPPRVVRGSLANEGFAASGGSVRLVAMFKDAPVALAAVDARAYLVFETLDRGGRVMRREVNSVTAVPSGLGALWRFEPDGALTTHPSLPSDGLLLGIGCVGGRLGAVIDDSTEANPIGPRIGVLEKDRWLWAPVDSRIAAEIVAHPGRGHVFSSRDGLGISISTPSGEIEVWTGAPQIPRQADEYVFGADDDGPLLDDRRGKQDQSPQPPAWVWNSARYSIPSMQGSDPAMGVLMECSGVRLWIQPDARGRTSVYELHPKGSTRLVSFEESTSPLSVACLQEEGRLVLVWADVQQPGPATKGLASSSPKRTYEAREISVSTGRVLYEGPAKSLGPVSPTDLRILSTVLLLIMGVALLLVLRPDPDDAVVMLPEGFALAESGRRLMASMIDGVLAWWIGAAFWGMEAGQALSPAAMVSGQTWYVAGTALVVGMLLGTIGEWRAGRSPGKLLTGCEVVSLISRPDAPPDSIPRPGLWRAIERNAVKWLLPPVAMLGLFDDQGRHRGDMIARTLVVIRYDPSEGDGAESEGE